MIFIEVLLLYCNICIFRNNSWFWLSGRVYTSNPQVLGRVWQTSTFGLGSGRVAVPSLIMVYYDITVCSFTPTEYWLPILDFYTHRLEFGRPGWKLVYVNCELWMRFVQPTPTVFPGKNYLTLDQSTGTFLVVGWKSNNCTRVEQVKHSFCALELEFWFPSEGINPGHDQYSESAS